MLAGSCWWHILTTCSAGTLFTGFNVEPISVDGTRFVCWDVGGQQKIRALWRSQPVLSQFFSGAAALVFVVDAADPSKDRHATARYELHDILASIAPLEGVPVVVMANKQDKDGARSAHAVAQEMGVATLRSHQCHVQPCSAVDGQGLREAFIWICQALRAA